MIIEQVIELKLMGGCDVRYLVQIRGSYIYGLSAFVRSTPSEQDTASGADKSNHLFQYF